MPGRGLHCLFWRENVLKTLVRSTWRVTMPSSLCTPARTAWSSAWLPPLTQPQLMGASTARDRVVLQRNGTQKAQANKKTSLDIACGIERTNHAWQTLCAWECRSTMGHPAVS